MELHFGAILLMNNGVFRDFFDSRLVNGCIYLLYFSIRSKREKLIINIFMNWLVRGRRCVAADIQFVSPRNEVFCARLQVLR